MKRYCLILAVITIAFSSCHGWFGNRIRGNGNITTENRSVRGYTGIDVSAAIDVYVSQGETESVKVVTDANLQEYVEIRVEDGVLLIYPGDHSNLRPSDGIKVYVTGKIFKYFEASSASDIHGETKIEGTDEIKFKVSSSGEIELTLKSPKVSGDISSGAALRLSGETKNFTIEASSGAGAKCFDLMAENTEAKVSSGADADVFASVKLTAKASSGGSIDYKGNATTNVETSSGGSVSKQN